MKLISTYLFIIFFLESTKCFSSENPSQEENDSSKHPLDPLSGLEIDRTAEIIKKETPRCLFVIIQLQEPPKSLLVAHFVKNTSPRIKEIPRQSFTVCINKENGRVMEYIVDINENKVVKQKTLEMGIQTLFTDEDAMAAKNIVKSNPEFQERCRKYGYSNMSLVYTTDWTMGYTGNEPSYSGRHLCQMVVYGMQFKGDNPYAHPFPFAVIVDLDQQIVLSFSDCPTGEGFSNDNANVTIPKASHNYDPDFLPKHFLRKDVKPINISSPKGVSYSINGYHVQWQKFSFRVGFNPREGLVLHWLTYNDNGTVRPLVYRAAVSEMWIPYGDPRPPTGPRKAVFDEGEYGLGFSCHELVAQQDCLGTVHFFDGYANNNDGTWYSVPQCICVYEEDTGILWKHTAEVSGKEFTVRSTRLVVTFGMQAGNYNYLFYWQFYQDATIQLEVKLTGILSTSLLSKGATPPPYGNILADQVFAQFHQHFFCVRMDVDIDGVENSAEMVELVSPPDQPSLSRINYNFNPYGNAIISKHTPLNTAGEARTKNSAETSRVWKIFNPNKINSINNKPVSYILKSENNVGALFRADSSARHGKFTAFDVWITQYDDKQIFAGGDYLKGNDLSEWVEKNPEASTVNRDIVLWHVFGVTHNPRIEDWPVMSTESVGFMFKPNGFFTANPGVDVPKLYKSN